MARHPSTLFLISTPFKASILSRSSGNSSNFSYFYDRYHNKERARRSPKDSQCRQTQFKSPPAQPSSASPPPVTPPRTRTAEIKTTTPTGAKVSYFLKAAQGNTGKGMLHREYHSMSALHSAQPTLAPKPLAWGTYKNEPTTHFFLCAFHVITGGIPDLTDFPRVVTQLHKNGVSPDGKFGFPLRTCQRRLAQDNTQCDTWEEAFSRSMEQFFDAEEEVQGPDGVMAVLRGELWTRPF
ncbi:uncharacterized protein DSM5745_01419 [Aspergillus mulundensis]|uniref:Uncharacterized protein n=1 Tax=Aspergillus mulundensis TaxID=1810919 RepID=A0A3D8T6A6_9EURO|nr:hypothetical protein DSM5745_01419 [Aspergillus mulundensis]RDW94097.1 hypothetical protein DSM5745_01419 [Aspergillus mulundensis]